MIFPGAGLHTGRNRRKIKYKMIGDGRKARDEG